MKTIGFAILAAAALVACERNKPLSTAELPPAATPQEFPAVAPPAPGTPGGLPDDRTPLAEGRITPQSAQGAGQVLQTYFALIGQHNYGEAWKLWADDGRASGMTEPAFESVFGRYHQFNAQIGAPGLIEGAAGSLYVDVPVVIYGRLKTGEEVHMNGPITLKRVNNVPGSTAEQQAWHIAESAVRPTNLPR